MGKGRRERKGNSLCGNSDLFTNFRAYCKANLTLRVFGKGRR